MCARLCSYLRQLCLSGDEHTMPVPACAAGLTWPALFTAPHRAAPPQVLGFPVQLVGLLTLPYLGVRWLVDGKDASGDLEAAAVRRVLVSVLCVTGVIHRTT
eukprot:GHRQ01022144.1.p4 GENE.GHRQ01022144.1~~GHRQ01022144.1.p4  ORF type:complete len:102 (-),score=25.41 GHRQ01022144.1:350-655(-)